MYSGYALYTRNGLVVRLDQYKSGVKVYGVTLLGVSDMSEFNKRMRRVVAKLRKMKFQQKSNISQTRWGEDEWDDLERWANENGIDYREFDNEDDFLNSMIDYYGEPDGGFGGDVLGMRFDEDGTATFYVDTDGDGNADVAFDQFWEDPEPEIHGDNTTTNNGSGGGTGSSSTSGGTTQTDDNNGSSGGSIGGGDNTGDQGTSNSTPKDLSYLHGDETYYYQRHNDALTRGIKPPPSYYLEYGDKYYNRFKNLKPNLSPLGSTWVSDTALGLHIAMTNLLKNNPGIERDEAALKSLAFKTHADVYIKSGITSLPWSDAFLIFIQVDLCDWFSIEAIEQAATVGTAYIEDKSYDKAMEFMQNYNYLEQLIEQKIIDSTTGTRSGQTYTVKDYINAHFGELIVCYEQNYSDFELPN